MSDNPAPTFVWPHAANPAASSQSSTFHFPQLVDCGNMTITASVAISTLPGWVQEAMAYLQDAKLGEEWDMCVMYWAKLERQLDYGSDQNMQWNVAGRPEEFKP
jgi:uncharacterized protein (DUF1810 family)